MRQDDPTLALAVGGLVTFGIGLALVSVRGVLPSDVIALIFALIVVVIGRLTSVVGSVVAAIYAALTFDFFFTQPYLSLKISSTEEIGVTVVLLAVGIFAGGVSARTRRERRLARSDDMDVAAIRRVLTVAGTQPIEDVEMVVRAELLKVLDLFDCGFVPGPTTLPELGSTGVLPSGPLLHRKGGFQLPVTGFAIPAVAGGRRVGSLVCTPVEGVGVDARRRRTAIALAHILALAIVSGPSDNRKAANG